MASRETQFRIALLGLFLLRCQSFTLSNEEYVSEPAAGRQLGAHSCDDDFHVLSGLTGSCDAGCPTECPAGQMIVTGLNANPCDRSDSYSPQCHPASCNNPCGQGTCFAIRDIVECSESSHTGCDCTGCCHGSMPPPAPPMQPAPADCPWLGPNNVEANTLRPGRRRWRPPLRVCERRMTEGEGSNLSHFFLQLHSGHFTFTSLHFLVSHRRLGWHTP